MSCGHHGPRTTQDEVHSALDSSQQLPLRYYTRIRAPDVPFPLTLCAKAARPVARVRFSRSLIMLAWTYTDAATTSSEI